MGITSYVFVLAFLPITLIGWSILNRLNWYNLADFFLMLVSLIFIGSYDYRFVLIILITVSMNYICVKYMDRIKRSEWRKIVTIILVAVNVGVLFFLKYGNWFRIVINREAVLWKLLIPIGISFYTLEQVRFIVDVYRTGEIKYTFREYVLFSIFFPAIVSGPILRHDDFILQLRSKDCRFILTENVSEGLMSFCLGMGKKVIIASWLGKIAGLGFDNVESTNSVTMLLSVLAYTLQLYFDFSGYCDIVEGVASMMGFKLPMNFNSPYKASSVGEFWKRWHMTLTDFLTRYVYIPLGGNRKGRVRQNINIFIVFLVSGLWHGASFTYILWGMMHGICLIADKIIGKFWAKLPAFVGRCVTFSMVALMWVPFRANSTGDACVIYRRLFWGDKTIVKDLGQYTLPMVTYLCENYVGISQEMLVSVQNITTVLIMILLLGIVFFAKNTRELTKGRNGNWVAVICGIILFATVLHFQEVGTFIYEGF